MAHLIVLIKKETLITVRVQLVQNPVPSSHESYSQVLYVLRCYLGSSPEYEDIVIVLDNWYPKIIRNRRSIELSWIRNSDKKSWAIGLILPFKPVGINIR